MGNGSIDGGLAAIKSGSKALEEVAAMLDVEKQVGPMRAAKLRGKLRTFCTQERPWLILPPRHPVPSLYLAQAKGKLRVEA